VPGDWEIRGLFGNEYAMENAIEGLKGLQGPPEFRVLDRRNLQVVLSRRDEKMKELVRNVIKIAHGFVESDAPLGKYDKEREQLKRKKLKEAEEKRKRTSGKH
jgi:hypothetical protein